MPPSLSPPFPVPKQGYDRDSQPGSAPRQAGAREEGHNCLAQLRTLGITRKAKVAPRSAGGSGQHCSAHPNHRHPPR